MDTSGKLLFILKRDIDNGEAPLVPLNAICMWHLEIWQLPQKILGLASLGGVGMLNLAQIQRKDADHPSPL